MFLIILSANGLVIPAIAWVIFGISWILAIAKSIAKAIKEHERKSWIKVYHE